MRKQVIFYAVILSLIAYGIVMTSKVIRLKTSLKDTETELSDTRDELQEANDKLEAISEKINLQSSSAGDIEDKLDNIQSYASDLESSIDDLLREIRWTDCDACQTAIWDIERKAKSVESDFDNLQSEINF
jgi:peptidoglycan hydrolase CwlO-like protein